MLRYLLPLAVFTGLVLLFLFGLNNDPRLVPSPFIGKPLPAISLPGLKDPAAAITTADLKGEVALLNIWATWCIPCRQEHPLLVDLDRRTDVRIYGLNYKDIRQDALAWLEQLGDPYDRVLFDEAGTAGIDLGVYGVPETFVIDRDGIVRYKHVGPLTQEVIDEAILPLIVRLQGPAS